ncbi:beta-lactamase family protein [Streptomyces sp. NA04227]|uniref:serine hydrolase domain-containing protein n=1 Tax=Streptomyces sp. NA04227 TaxID=2742136 RepID=UPI001591C04D|nr:serine hydrolase domain-containing protein [Streptomyces sp. NA04227]QKW06482.1 beta-lactamase family protein [Streptomyces sp. NA04227]
MAGRTTRRTATRRTAIRRTTVVAGAVLAAAVTAGVLAAPASAAQGHDHEGTREALRASIEAGVPGATVGVRDRGRVWKAGLGTGDLRTGEPRGTDDHYRVGSISKTFLATVLLQLQAEGEIDLDDSVDKWLPGVVDGNGHDGRRITVRQLLNHTSGVFNVTEDPEFQRIAFSEEFLKHRYETKTAGELVAVAMKHKPYFAPGKGWHYSNTNYNLAGMIVEKVTGRTYAEEIRSRIIEPLGLHGTRSPGTDPSLPGPHSRAYSKLSEDPAAKKTYDVTRMNPSLAGASGDMISNSADLNRFYSALLGGKLLPKAQLKQMRTTVETDPESPESRYGLGLISSELSCGVTIWGHSGGIHGSSSSASVMGDGRHALAFNFNGDWAGDAGSVIEAEYCGD